jgi:lipoprotein-anchoring transpeptidase ErfK/SrfK
MVVAVTLALLEATALALVIDRAGAAPLGDRRVPLVMTAVAPVRSPDRSVEPAAEAPEPAEAPTTREGRSLLVHVERSMAVTARPGGGAVIGTMPTVSRFYDVPLVAWVQEVSPDGRFGLVTIPYLPGDRTGWIALRGLQTAHTTISVEADLSEHQIVVRRGVEVLFRAPAAIGATTTPTPAGHYFVTDRVPFPNGGALGTFAFGISGIQPNLPVGWSGGDQLAIHGTNDPSSIGTSASAGCLRVSQSTLSRLEPLLRLGTPVVVHG